MKNFIVSYIVMIAALLSITSCNTEDYYSPIVGSWETSYTDLGPIHSRHPDFQQFYFYRSGYGEQYFYDDFGQWVSIGFTWNERGFDNSVILTYDSGERRQFYYRFYREYLELSTDPYFNTYLGLVYMY